MTKPLDRLRTRLSTMPDADLRTAITRLECGLVLGSAYVREMVEAHLREVRRIA